LNTAAGRKTRAASSGGRGYRNGLSPAGECSADADDGAGAGAAMYVERMTSRWDCECGGAALPVVRLALLLLPQLRLWEHE
jgi:hypothetical protein